MATNRNGKKPLMVRCEYCGEDYADSYKKCPFCDEQLQDNDEDYDYDEFDEEMPRSGGKRLSGNRRGGGYGGSPSAWKIIGTVISLVLIVTAVIIVILVVKPLVEKGKTQLPDGSPAPAITATPSTNPAPTDSVAPTDSADPVAPTGDSAVTPAPTPVATPVPTPVATPATGQTATDFTLDKGDFSMSDQYGDPVRLRVTFSPAGTTGTVVWTSSNPDVATVSAEGTVSRGTKNGQATITATMGGVQRTCLVRCNFSGAATSTGGTTGAATSTKLSLNTSDFTFNAKSNPAVQMKVNGTSATPVWSIGNTAVATISSSGVVTPVGKGMTTITCTVDGQTLKCIVRCSF